MEGRRGPQQYPRELRERAVRLVAESRGEYESEWAAMRSIAAKLGVGSTETLRKWVLKGANPGFCAARPLRAPTGGALQLAILTALESRAGVGVDVHLHHDCR